MEAFIRITRNFEIYWRNTTKLLGIDISLIRITHQRWLDLW